MPYTDIEGREVVRAVLDADAGRAFSPAEIAETTGRDAKAVQNHLSWLAKHEPARYRKEARGLYMRRGTAAPIQPVASNLTVGSALLLEVVGFTETGLPVMRDEEDGKLYSVRPLNIR